MAVPRRCVGKRSQSSGSSFTEPSARKKPCIRMAKPSAPTAGRPRNANNKGAASRYITPCMSRRRRGSPRAKRSDKYPPTRTPEVAPAVMEKVPENPAAASVSPYASRKKSGSQLAKIQLLNAIKPASARMMPYVGTAASAAIVTRTGSAAVPFDSDVTGSRSHAAAKLASNTPAAPSRKKDGRQPKWSAR